MSHDICVSIKNLVKKLKYLAIYIPEWLIIKLSLCHLVFGLRVKSYCHM